jgi:Zn-dependent oligopeptidase
MNKLINFRKIDLNQFDFIFTNAKADIKKSMDQISQIDNSNLSYLTCFHNPLVISNKVNLDTYILKIVKYHPNKQIRERSDYLVKELAIYESQQFKRQDVYSKIQSYFYDKYTFEKSSLTEEQVAHVEKTIKKYGYMGLTSEAVQQIDLQITDLAYKYNKNLQLNPIVIELNSQELEGCDQAFKKGKIILSASVFNHIMKYCSNRETRKKVYLKYFEDINSNSLILEKIIELRTQKANLSGFHSFSDLILDKTIAKNKFEVKNFLDKIFDKYNPQTSINEIKSYLPPGFKLELWDLGYYTEKIKCMKTNFSLSQIENMIDWDSLLKGIIQICKDLYGYSINEITNPDLVYGPDIKLFEVKVSNSEKVLGYFYLDIKLKGYKIPTAHVVCLVNKSYTSLPIGLLVCNFTPKLLFDNVITLFHEFGHMIHFLSDTRFIPINSMSNAPRDFIETPAKLFELWAYSEYGLKQIFKPEYKSTVNFSKLSSQLLSHRKILFPIQYSKNLMKAYIDLDLHSNKRIMHKAALENYNKIFYSIDSTPQQINILVAWPHLSGGYASEFYSYLWSEFNAKRIYEKFKSKENDKKLGLAYIDLLLSKGSLMDFNEQINLFLNLKI